jgi:hypothetical protein
MPIGAMQPSRNQKSHTRGGSPSIIDPMARTKPHNRQNPITAPILLLVQPSGGTVRPTVGVPTLSYGRPVGIVDRIPGDPRTAPVRVVKGVPRPAGSRSVIVGDCIPGNSSRASIRSGNSIPGPSVSSPLGIVSSPVVRHYGKWNHQGNNYREQ